LRTKPPTGTFATGTLKRPGAYVVCRFNAKKAAEVRLKRATIYGMVFAVGIKKVKA